MPDVHEPAAGCKVVHLGPNPLYSRFPVRNFRSDLSITSEVGDGLVALERAMRDLGPDGDSAVPDAPAGPRRRPQHDPPRAVAR